MEGVVKGKSNRSVGSVKERTEKLAEEEKERLKRIKKSELNPAAEGAKLDRKGVKYSGEKGTKTFFSKRKHNIERVNERLGFIQPDSEGFFQYEEVQDV